MQRIMTQDLGRNFKLGRIYDLPLLTWRHLEKQLEKRLEDFSECVDENPHAIQRREARYE